MITALSVEFAAARRPDYDLAKTQEMLENLQFARHKFVIHDHRERNHQGFGNELIDGVVSGRQVAWSVVTQRLGGFLRDYYRAA